MKLNKTIFSILLLFNISLFAQQKNFILFKKHDFTFAYDIDSPSTKEKLPHKLREISGLSYLNKNTLLAVQDEKGIIFFIDSETGKIKEEKRFYKDGDYEGVELINNDVWVLKSNGKLFQVKDFLGQKESESIKHETILKPRNDSEGLAYDEINNRLLIACKGYPFLDKDLDGKSKKAIYIFNLNTQKLLKTPAFIIELDSIKQFHEHNTTARLGIKLLSYFNPSSGDLTFQPSAIAVHPLTHDYYILGSVGKLLIILNHKFEFLAIVKLDKKDFPQAEGICFDPDGNMFISNEGKGKNASLLKFNYQHDD